MGIFGKKTLKEYIQLGKKDKIEELLDPNTINDLDTEGNSLLEKAIESGKLGSCEALIDNGASIIIEKEGIEINLIDKVIESQNIELLSYFLNTGEIIPSEINGERTIHYLLDLEKLNYDFLKFILNEEEFDFDECDDYNQHSNFTYLFDSEYCNARFLDLFLKNGAVINEENYSIIFKSLARNIRINKEEKAEVFRHIETCFPKIFPNDFIQSKLVSVLRSNKNQELFLALIDRKFDIDPKLNSELSQYIREDKFDTEQQKILVDLNTKHQLNLSLPTSFLSDNVIAEIANLDDAARAIRFFDIVLSASKAYEDKISIIEKMIENGLDINLCKPLFGDEMNILSAIASLHTDFDNELELANFFLNKSVRIEEKGVSALYQAIHFEHFELAELFINKGANINFIDHKNSNWLPRLYNMNDRGCYLTVDSYAKAIELMGTAYQNQKMEFPLYYEFEVDSWENTKVHFVSSLVRTNFDYFKVGLNFLINKLNWDIKTIFEESNDMDNIFGHVCFWGQGDKFSYLLSLDPNLQIYQREDQALYWAIVKNFSLDTIKLLIDNTEDLYRKHQYAATNSEYFKYFRIGHIGGVISNIKDENIAIQIIDLLLEKGADIHEEFEQELADGVRRNGVYRMRLSCLELAVQNQKKKIFQHLLKKGFDPNTRTCQFQETVMHFLASRTNLSSEEILEFMKLVDNYKAIDVNIRSSVNSTPILSAASKGQYLIVEWLIEKGANPNDVGGFDDSPNIHRAISNWNYVDKEMRLKTIKVLIDAGADINAYDRDQMTPLMNAANFGCLEITRLLLESGADPNLLDDKGQNAIYYAIAGDYQYDLYQEGENEEDRIDDKLKSQIIRELIKSGIDKNYIPAHNPPIFTCIYKELKLCYKLLITKTNALEHKDHTGQLPINLVFAGSSDYFINIMGAVRNVDFTVETLNGSNLIHDLAFNPNTILAKNVCQVLLSERVNLPYKANNYGTTPLMNACIYSNLEMIKFFIENDYASTNERDIDNSNPLIYSVLDYESYCEEETLLETIKYLIERGDNPNHKNNKGESFFTILKQNEQTSLLSFLASVGIKEDNIGF